MAAKTPRKIVTPSQPRPAPTKPPAAPPETLSHKIGDAFKAAIDTLSEAEHLHHRLDPDPSRDPEPE